MQKTRKSLLEKMGAVLFLCAMVVSMMTMVSFADETTSLTAYTGQISAGNYSISTAAQLDTLSDAVNAGTSYAGSTFILTADIDLAVSDTYGSLSWTGGTDWTPIGGMCAEDGAYVPDGSGFQGVFSGYDGTAVHSISSMNISVSGVSDATKAGYGLFGYVNGGAIGNVNVSGSINITGNAEYVGSIAGYTSGNIYNCDSSVMVNAAAASNVGGITGAAERKAAGNAVVKYCKNTGAVNGGKRVGGIAGGIYSVTGGIVTVKDCGNEADVAASSNGKVYTGGVAGYLRGTMNSCYNSGDVTGSSAGRYAAGLAGLVNGYSAPYGKIEYSYSSAASVTAENAGYFKALYATADSSANAEITNAYWLENSSLSQPVSSTWGTCTNVQSVTAGQLSGANLVTDADGIIDCLNVNGDSDGFALRSTDTRPVLLCLENSSFAVPDNEMAASDATPVTADSDDADMIFVDSLNGNDSAEGYKTSPVATLSRAMNLVSGSRNVIYLVNSVNVDSSTSIRSSQAVTIRRSCRNHDYMFNVTAGTLTLGSGITVDGNRSCIDAACKSLINVDGGNFVLNGAALSNNYANCGGAVRQIAGSTTVKAGTISNNSSIARSCGIYVYGGDFKLKPVASTTVSDVIYLESGRRIDCSDHSLDHVNGTINVKTKVTLYNTEVAFNVNSESAADKFVYSNHSYALNYMASTGKILLGDPMGSVTAPEENAAPANGTVSLLDAGTLDEQTHTESFSIDDGSTIVGMQTITGGTEENPIVVTISGDVACGMYVSSPAVFLVTNGSYVKFVGKDNARVYYNGKYETGPLVYANQMADIEIQSLTLDANHTSKVNDSIISDYMDNNCKLVLSGGTKIINNDSTHDAGGYSAMAAGVQAYSMVVEDAEITNNNDEDSMANQVWMGGLSTGGGTLDLYKAKIPHETDDAANNDISTYQTNVNIRPLGNISLGMVSCRGGATITVIPQAGSPISSYRLLDEDEEEYTDIPTEETDLTNKITSLDIEVSEAPAAPAFAASIENVSKDLAAAGETFTADVVLKSDTVPAAAQLDLNVNSDVAKVVAVTPAEGIGTADSSFTDGTAKVSFYGNTASAAEGLKVATVTFEAVADGTASITLANDGVAGTAGDPDAEYTVTIPETAAEVTIKSPTIETAAFGGNYQLVRYTPNAAVAEGKTVKYGDQEMYLADDGSWYCVIAKDVTPSLDSVTITEGTQTGYTAVEKGDVNENGKINIIDAQIAYDIANSVYTGFEKLTVTGVLKADVNNNMAVDALDARAIQVYVHTGSFAVQ